MWVHSLDDIAAMRQERGRAGAMESMALDLTALLARARARLLELPRISCRPMPYEAFKRVKSRMGAGLSRHGDHAQGVRRRSRSQVPGPRRVSCRRGEGFISQKTIHNFIGSSMPFGLKGKVWTREASP